MALGDRYKNGRGHSIYDNVSGGEMWIVNDEDPAKIGQGFENFFLSFLCHGHCSILN